MNISGTIVKPTLNEYTNKAGEPAKAYKFYLASPDPLKGAQEVSCSEEDFGQLVEGQKVSFIPSFIVRNQLGNLGVILRVNGDLKVNKA